MGRQRLMLVAICLGTLAAAAIIGCSSTNTSGGGSNSGGMMGSGAPTSPSGGGSSGNSGGGMMGGGSGSNSYSSIGERIYLTGVGGDGLDIPRSASRVAQGSLMMGGGGCASCHGADGRGGTIRMMSGTAVEAPDITYDALIKSGFTDATILRAIQDGLDESGKPLSVAMPRWQMSSLDLAATIAYLRQLSAR
jgi:mono/diheme cytochrome c family protein